MSFGRFRPVEHPITESLEMSSSTEKKSPSEAIVHVAFEAALTPAIRRALSGKASVAVVVIVPAAAWVGHCKHFWHGRFGDRWYVLDRDGANRSEHKATIGNSRVSEALAAGKSIVGIATSMDILPSTLVASADHTMHLTVPTGGALRQVLNAHLGRPIAEDVPALVGTGLDLDDLTAAFRPKSTSRQIVARIERATRRRIGSENDDRLGSLDSATEYGLARRWALELAKDLEDGCVSQASRSLVVYGETGTGKTRFANLVAKHLGLPLISFSIADLFGGTSDGALGGVIQATNAIFDRVFTAKNCVFFLDELDALPNRATISDRGRDWWLPVITNFMLKLDSAFSRGEEKIFIAATNYVSRIDSALLRPGRYERAIEIRRPDLAGTINILGSYLPELDLEARTDLGQILRGSTGAEIMMIARDARRIARREDRALRPDDVRAIALPIENIPAARLRRICIHEAAHAVGILVLDCGNLHGIVVRTRDGTAGRTMAEHKEDDLLTRRDFEARVVATLCGRVAECALIGEVSVGSGLATDSDMAIATRIIGSLHAGSLGDDLAFRADQQSALAAVARDPSLRRRVEADLLRLEKDALRLVRRNRHAILAIAEELAKTRHLTGEAIRELYEESSREPKAKPEAKSARRPNAKNARS